MAEVIFLLIIGALFLLPPLRLAILTASSGTSPSCGPRALACVTGRSIPEAEDAIRAVRDMPLFRVRATTQAELIAAIPRLGSHALPVPQGPNLTLNAFLRSRVNGHYLVFVNYHVLPVIDGRIHPADSSYLPCSVNSIWLVERHHG